MRGRRHRRYQRTMNRTALACLLAAGCADQAQPAAPPPTPALAIAAEPPAAAPALITGCMVPGLYELAFAADATWDCGPGAPPPVRLRLGANPAATLVDPFDPDASVVPYAIGCRLSVKYASYRYGFDVGLTFADGGFTGTIDRMSWQREDGTRCLADRVAVTGRAVDSRP
jgi:hypothetical protein